VSVALVIQYAIRVSRIVLSPVVYPAVEVSTKSLNLKKCVLIFSTLFVWNISYFKKYSARYLQTFDVFLTVRHSIDFFQVTKLMYTSFILQQYICYIIILNMFRAVPCSSSGGQIVLLQPLVSSLSVNSRTVCRLRADCSPLSTAESDDTRGCNNTISSPEDEQDTARNMLRIIM